MNAPDTVKTMRCFVAIDLSANVIDGLREVQETLRNALKGGPRTQWVSPASMHLTLKFLGDQVDVGVTPALVDAMATLRHQARSFELDLRGLGAFPKASFGRVLWVGVEAPDALLTLREAIEGLAEHVGFDRETKAFRPHVTLGRIKGRAGIDLTDALRAQDGDLGRCLVDSVALYQSKQTSRGPSYEVLHRVALKAGDSP